MRPRSMLSVLSEPPASTCSVIDLGRWSEMSGPESSRALLSSSPSSVPKKAAESTRRVHISHVQLAPPAARMLAIGYATGYISAVKLSIGLPRGDFCSCPTLSIIARKPHSLAHLAPSHQSVILVIKFSFTNVCKPMTRLNGKPSNTAASIVKDSTSLVALFT